MRERERVSETQEVCWSKVRRYPKTRLCTTVASYPSSAETVREESYLLVNKITTKNARIYLELRLLFSPLSVLGQSYLQRGESDPRKSCKIGDIGNDPCETESYGLVKVLILGLEGYTGTSIQEL